MTEKIRVFYPGTAVNNISSSECFRIFDGRINCYLEVRKERSLEKKFYLGTLLKGMSFRGHDICRIDGSLELEICYVAEIPSVAEIIDDCDEFKELDLLRVFGFIYPNTEQYRDEEISEYFYRVIINTFQTDQQVRIKSDLKNRADIDAIFSRIGRYGGFESTGSNQQEGISESETSLTAAVEYLLKCYNLKVSSEVMSVLSAESSDYHSSLSDFALMSGVRIREVMLPADFYCRTSMNPLLAFRIRDGRAGPVILQMEHNSCRCVNPVTGDSSTVKAGDAASFQNIAYQFYPAVGFGKPSLKELAGFVFFGFDRIRSVLGVFLLITFIFSVMTPGVMYFIMGTSVPRGDYAEMSYFTVILIMLGLCSICVRIFPEFVIQIFNGTLYENLQGAVYDKLLRMPVSEFKKYESGDLVSRIMSTEYLRSSLFRCFMGLFKFISFSLTSSLVMFFIDWDLTLCTLGISAVMLAAIWIIGFRRYPLVNETMMLSGRLDGMLRQFFNGVDKIRLSGAEENVLRKFMKMFSDYVLTDYSMRLYRSSAEIIRKIYVPVSLALLCAVAGGFFGIHRSLPVFASFLTAFMIFQVGVVSMVEMLWTLPFLRSEYNRIKPVLCSDTENSDASVPAGVLDGGIEVSHVYFSYSEDETPVLEDINFDIKPGEFVAFVGASGSGKSTLLKLLLGFMFPDSGVVYYGDRDLSGIELGSLRRQMGVILQTGRIFSGSILENVTFGTDGYSKDDVLRAIGQAELSDLISELPMGIYTRVSTDNLSGGQQQRILIARALIGNPRILIMDEATSALDNITQQKIQNNLEQLKMTRIVVAHRLSTVVNADRIFVMDHGKIVQCGTYNELNSQPGIFKNLVAKQTFKGCKNA